MVIELKMWICNQKHWILDKEGLIRSVSFRLSDHPWWEDLMIDYQIIEWAHGLEHLRDFNLIIHISLHFKEHFKMLFKEIEN